MVARDVRLIGCLARGSSSLMGLKCRLPMHPLLFLPLPAPSQQRPLSPVTARMSQVVLGFLYRQMCRKTEPVFSPTLLLPGVGLSLLPRLGPHHLCVFPTGQVILPPAGVTTEAEGVRQRAHARGPVGPGLGSPFLCSGHYANHRSFPSCPQFLPLPNSNR